MKLRIDYRARRHPAWWAFLMHRISGLALAIFLPLHFWALGLALHGEVGQRSLEGFLRFSDRPLFKCAEWGLVVLLALHMMGGVRLLLIEFTRWTGLRKNWIAGAAGLAAFAGMAFALALFF